MRPRRGPVLALSAAVALLVGSAPAHAAPPWSEPLAVPGGGSSSALALSPTGRGLVTTLGPGGYSRRFPGTSAATLDPGGSVGPFRVLAQNFDAGGYPGRVTVDAAGRVSAVGEEGTRSGSRLMAATGALGGVLSRRRDIGLGEPIASSAVGTNVRGDQAVLFQVSGSSRSFRRRSVYLVVRRAGRSFGRAVRVARGPGVASLGVAVGDGGQVAVAWARERRVGVRRYSAGGGLGRAQTVGDAGTDTVVRPAVAPSGAVLVSWAAEDLRASGRDPAADYGPYDIRAVLAAPGARFGSARRLGLNEGASVAAEPLGADRFLVAYEDEGGDRDAVRVIEVGTAGFGPAQTVSDPGVDSALADLATGPRGEAVVAWLTRNAEGSFDRVAAAAQAPRAPAFSAPESVAGPFRSPGIDLAIDPAGGRVLVSLDVLEGPVRLVTRPPVSG